MSVSYFRERNLTALVIIEAIELFVLAPLSSATGAPLSWSPP